MKETNLCLWDAYNVGFLFSFKGCCVQRFTWKNIFKM